MKFPVFWIYECRDLFICGGNTGKISSLKTIDTLKDPDLNPLDKRLASNSDALRAKSNNRTCISCFHNHSNGLRRSDPGLAIVIK